MKKIIFSLVVLFIINEACFASAIYESRIINTNSKLSNISSSLNKEREYSLAINELKNKINKNPNDYILTTFLVDLYLKSGKYNEAYKELVYLANLSKQGKLNDTTIANLSNVKKSFINNAKNIHNKSFVYLDMALINLILKDTTQAEKMIIGASKNITNEEAFNQTLDLIFGSYSNIEKAIASFDIMLMNNPNNVPIKKMKALYLKQLNRTDEATKEYFSALKLKPNDEEIIYNLYKIYANKNTAENDIVKKIFGKDNYENAYLSLAKIFLNNNDIQGAETFSKKLINDFPENVDGLIILSEIYRRSGKLKESYEVLQNVRDKADTTERISKYNVLLAKLSDEPVQEANSLMNNGLYEQALSVLNEANSDNLYVILSKARANYFLNNKTEALELLNRAMSFYPNNADVFYYFAFYFYQEKDMQNARKYINKTLQISPNHNFGLKMLDLINKADADKLVVDINSALEMENFAEAMRLITDAIAINPKDDKLYYYKGIIYTSMNDYHLATAPFYKALEINPNNVMAYYYLAVCFDNLSEEENALSYYKKFLDRMPADAYGESEKIKYAQVRISKLSKK